MTPDIRNAYGFPIVAELEAAKERDAQWAAQRKRWRLQEAARQYAAAAKERNKPACDCEPCREKELLPAVQQITQRWKS